MSIYKLIVISPDYLEAIYPVADEFSCDVYGYGDALVAKEKIQKFFVDDLLGTAVVCERLSDVAGLVEFIKEYRKLKVRKRILIVGKDLAGIEKYRGSDISYIRVDLITDTVIKQQVIGPILLYNFEPYQYHEKKLELPALGICKRTTYRPLFPNEFYLCMEPIEKLDSYNKTVMFDNPLKQLSGLYREIRMLQIDSLFSGEKAFSAVKSMYQQESSYDIKMLLYTLFPMCRDAFVGGATSGGVLHRG